MSSRFFNVHYYYFINIEKDLDPLSPFVIAFFWAFYSLTQLEQNFTKVDKGGIMREKEEEKKMELWIRSQNRGSIIKAKEISLERSNKREGWVVMKVNITDGSNGWIIGEYETEERALEVLDEIHQRLINLQCIEIIGAANITQQMKRNGIDCVYEMPEE